MFLTDKQIADLCSFANVEAGLIPMITPYVDHQVNASHKPTDGNIHLVEKVNKIISYGQSSCGYDIRLDPLLRFPKVTRSSSHTLDPKIQLETDWEEFQATQKFVLYPGNIVLGHSFETIVMPHDVGAICMTKSTYARVGVFANVTPLEPGWRGTLTIELANLGQKPVFVYPNEGICQLLFFRLEHVPNVTYDMRAGKYMNQTAPTLAK